MSEMQELKPLPCWHCETADTITTELDALTGYKWGYAACSCGARGPDVRTGYDGGSQAAWRVEAITAWNTRPREAALEAEVERLRVASNKAIRILSDTNRHEVTRILDAADVLILSHPKGADDGK